MDLKSVYSKDIDTLQLYTQQFLNHQLSKIDFKKKSGPLGVYAEDCGTRFMVRLRLPSGIFPIAILKQIYLWAKANQLDSIHLTTRQTIQLHHLCASQMIQLLRDALELGITTKGSGGNYPRNVALSPLSGVDPNEAFDPTPYALAASDYFAKRMPTYQLPRKFKVSFSNTPEDTAHATIQDMGFVACHKDQKPYFTLYLGGGLGRNPRKSILYDEPVAPSEILYYIEAMINLFVCEGNYKNKHQARLRYIVDQLGDDGFLSCFKTHLKKVYAHTHLKISPNTSIISKPGIPLLYTSPLLYAQKQSGLYSIYVHPIGGQLTLSHLRMLLKALDGLDATELCLAMEEGLYIRNLTGPEATTLLSVTKCMSGNTRISHSVACIGKPICQMGILESQSLLRHILDTLSQKGYQQDLLPSIHISGCSNSCGTHQISPIGFSGKKKRIDNILCNVYECYLGGSLSVDITHLGDYVGDLKEEDIPSFICWLYEQLQETPIDFNFWLTTQLPAITQYIQNLYPI